jgi:hypothetical protein
VQKKIKEIRKHQLELNENKIVSGVKKRDKSKVKVCLCKKVKEISGKKKIVPQEKNKVLPQKKDSRKKKFIVEMENGVHSSYQRSCVVISGDSLEDWKYIFRELRFRVGVSVQISFSPIFSKLRNFSLFSGVA